LHFVWCEDEKPHSGMSFRRICIGLGSRHVTFQLKKSGTWTYPNKWKTPKHPSDSHEMPFCCTPSTVTCTWPSLSPPSPLITKQVSVGLHFSSHPHWLDISGHQATSIFFIQSILLKIEMQIWCQLDLLMHKHTFFQIRCHTNCDSPCVKNASFTSYNHDLPWVGANSFMTCSDTCLVPVRTSLVL